MTKFYLLITRGVFLLSLTFSLVANAQTNPAAQTLPYSQDFSSLLSTSTVYPIGWQGWNISTAGSTTSFRLTPAVADSSLVASGTAASTTGGIYNYNGKIGMLASSSVDPSICLAINTTGVNRVLVNFDMMTIRNQKDASNTRVNQVDLQYRVGTTGNFISVSGIVNGIYQNNTTNQTTGTTPQNLLPKSFTLPTACNNQSVVQLRWVQRDFSGVGSRPSFAVDNIVICSSIIAPTIAVAGPNASCTGQTAIYGATIANGGTTPSYQWKKNGINTGTSISSLSISGLIVNDQISCVLTSTANCISSLTATSNTITIGVVGAPPAISSANVLQACPGQSNASIDLTISGGTPPYSTCWDTTNTVNGPMFGVTLGTKICPGNPYCGLGVLGNTASFWVDGADAKNLSLVRGITYTFNVNAVHPWHLSTDSVGANSIGLLTSGTTGTMPSGLTTVTLKPNNTHPSTLYYPCSSHNLMGYKIFLQNGYCVEDLTNLHTGTYSAIVTDANGCTAVNSYTINQTGGPVTATLGSFTNATCFGSANGNINLNPSGGSAPYTAFGTGPTFMVISQAKNHSHPQFGTGSANGYTIDNVQGKELTLMRGITYTFSVLAPGHPFFISTSIVGGPGNLASEVINGVTGSMTTSGTLTFTPNNTHPALLYYQCANHNNMGWKINIVDQLPNADLGNCMAGNYSLFVKNANGCNSSSPVNVTISQPPANIFYYDGDGDFFGLNSESALACTAPAGFVTINGDCNDANPDVHPGQTEICNGLDDNCDMVIDDNTINVSLTSITDATCGVNNGAIDIEATNGTGPYTICWDTVNIANGPSFGVMVGAVTIDNPYFNLGPPATFYIDGIEAKELTLTRGITYDFNVFSPGHPWHISTDFIGGNSTGLVTSGQSGAPNDNGTVTFTPNNTHSPLLYYVCAFHQYMGYNVLINDGYCVEDPVNLQPGTYSVVITDLNGCGTTATYTVNQTGSPIDATLNFSTDASCFGSADGTIDINPSGGTSPYTANGDGPTFMVISQAKNHSHPQFGTGSANGYTIDGIQGKEMTLIRGITYSFSVLTPNHPFFISTSLVGGPNNLGSEVTDGVTGSMTTNGTLTFTPNSNHPNLLYYQCANHNNMGWKINIVDQLPDGDLGNCMPGNYSLFVSDAGGCNTTNPINVFIGEPSANTFYYDGDNDTYGNDNESALGCTAPLGFTANSGDCNDSINAINPGQTELCNGIDDNCDATIDEGCNLTLGVKVFIEGYYSIGNPMQSPLLNSGESTDPLVSDSITVELHENVSPYGILDAKTVILDINGNATAQFPPSFIGINAYIVIRSRNTIETWSKLPVSLASTTFFDFTTQE